MENEELKAILQQISDAELKLGVLMNTINQSNLDIENLSKTKSDIEVKIENVNKELELLNKALATAGIVNQEHIASLKKQEVSAQSDFDIAKKGYDIKIDNLKNQVIEIEASFNSSKLELDKRYNADKTNYESAILTLKTQIDN